MSQILEILGRRPAVVLLVGLVGGLGLAKTGCGFAVAAVLQGLGLAVFALASKQASGNRAAGIGSQSGAPEWGSPNRRMTPRSLAIGGTLLVLAGLGLLDGIARIRTVPANHLLSEIPPRGDRDASVLGQVLALSARPDAGPNLELAVSRLDGRAVRGTMLLHLQKPALHPIYPGDGLELTVEARRIDAPLLPGAWDRGESLSFRGIYVEGSASEPTRIVPGPAWWRWIPALSDRIAEGLARAPVPGWAGAERWKGQHGPFLAAILLGRRDELSPELSEMFRRSGLFHLFAISGMNLALIAACVYGILGTVLGRRWGAGASMVAIVLYTALTVGQPSVVRAAWMVLIHLGGIVLGRRPDGVNSVCFAAAAVLLAQPGLVSDLGFQLTVLATCSVLLYTRPMARQIRLPRFLAYAVAASFAAQAVVLPLLLAHFRELSVYGIVSGVIAAIPFSAALALSMAAAVLIALGAGQALTGLILQGATACAWLLFEVARGFAGLPGAMVSVPRLGNAALVLCLLLWVSYRLRPTLGRAVLQASLVVAVAVLVLAGQKPEARAPLRITFLGVGNADCALIELPDGSRHLVDGAGDPRGMLDVGNLYVVPFLWSLGVRNLETAYLSHAHPDHGLGLLAVLNAFEVDRLRLAGPVEPKGLVHDLEVAARRQHARFELINPYTDLRYPLDENDRSLVLRLQMGRFSALFAGDVEEKAEHEVSDTYGARLRSTVLKVAHHGSCTSSWDPFLNAVQPRLAVVSVGAHNTFGHPCPAAVERLERALGPQRVLYTYDGSVRVSSVGTDMVVERYAGGGWTRLWTETLAGNRSNSP